MKTHTATSIDKPLRIHGETVQYDENYEENDNPLTAVVLICVSMAALFGGIGLLFGYLIWG